MPRSKYASQSLGSAPLGSSGRASLCAESAAAGSTRTNAATNSAPRRTIPLLRTRIRATSLGVPLVRLARFLHRRGERRHHFEHVAHDAIVGDLEDRRLFVLVDRDDRLARAHAGQMLDRSTD